MGKYLVVANQTALSPELRDCLVEKAKNEPGAEFVLVVPASPIEHLVEREEGQPRQVASRRAGRALISLTSAGIPIVGAHIGAGSLVTAIDEAIAERTKEYEGII